MTVCQMTVLAILGLMVGTSMALTEPCPADWVQFENKCYLFFKTSMNWDDANKYCRLQSATLATPENEAESRLLRALHGDQDGLRLATGQAGSKNDNSDVDATSVRKEVYPVCVKLVVEDNAAEQDKAAEPSNAETLERKERRRVERAGCSWGQPISNVYLSSYAAGHSTRYSTLEAAKAKCEALGGACAGVTKSGSANQFTVRGKPGTRSSPSRETSWEKGACEPHLTCVTAIPTNDSVVAKRCGEAGCRNLIWNNVKTSCAAFCQKRGLKCKAAWEDKDNDCNQESRMECNWTRKDDNRIDTDDYICECEPLSAGFVAPRNCDWKCYLDRYDDLRKAFGDQDLWAAKEHYEAYGEKEGRDCTCSNTPTNIPIDHIVDYAFLSDQIWMSDSNPGYLLDQNTGATFQVDYQLDWDYGHMWLAKTTHRGAQQGECIVVIRQEEDKLFDLFAGYNWMAALFFGAIRAQPEKLAGTDYTVYKQYNQMGASMLKHNFTIGIWMELCASVSGNPAISFTGHGLGGAMAMWLAYAIEFRTDIGIKSKAHVGKLVTFNAPPIHPPSTSNKRDLCPKSLQDPNVAVNFMIEGLGGPVCEDCADKGMWLAFSALKTTFSAFAFGSFDFGWLTTLVVEEGLEKFFDSVGRDCVKPVKLETDYISPLIDLLGGMFWKDVAQEIATNVKDVSPVYAELLASSGDYYKRDEFVKFCGEKKSVADFGCGCGRGYKDSRGKCPSLYEFRSITDACPIMAGRFDGAENIQDDDNTVIEISKEIDAHRCAEFCTVIEGCNSWDWNKANQKCRAFKSEIELKTNESVVGYWHGVSCPGYSEYFSEKDYQYDVNAHKETYKWKWDLSKRYDMDDITGDEFMTARVPSRLEGKHLGKAFNPEKACADICGRSMQCKSWTFDYSTYQCYALELVMAGRKKQKGWTSGLPRRSVIKNVAVGDAQCCAAKEYWSGCGSSGTSKCAQGDEYLDYSWCFWPVSTKSKCRNKCPRRDYGCGCEAQAKCLYGDKPAGFNNFVRFCDNNLQNRHSGRCCDQTGNGEYTMDLRHIAGCPRSSVSSIEVVGDCEVQLFTKKNNGGAQYSFGEGRYNAGSKSFPDGINYARITCN